MTPYRNNARPETAEGEPMKLELSQSEIHQAIAEYVGNQFMRQAGQEGYTKVVSPEDKGKYSSSQTLVICLSYDSSKDIGDRVTAKVEVIRK